MNKTKYALKLHLQVVGITSTQGISRCLHMSPVSRTVAWRLQKGLPVNKTARGPLTDLPDYSFTDRRPTPIMIPSSPIALDYIRYKQYADISNTQWSQHYRKSHQKNRMLKQREFASQIVKLSSELDFAVEREKKMIEEKEQERQNIIKNRLKPKGQALLKK